MVRTPSVWKRKSPEKTNRPNAVYLNKPRNQHHNKPLTAKRATLENGNIRAEARDRQTDRQHGRLLPEVREVIRPSPDYIQHSASQQTLCILWKQKVHYRCHNSLLLTLLWATLIQSTPYHLTPATFTLILSYHPPLGIPSALFPSGFPAKILYAFLFSPPPTFHTPNPSHPPHLITIICAEPCSVSFSPVSCLFVICVPTADLTSKCTRLTAYL